MVLCELALMDVWMAVLDAAIMGVLMLVFDVFVVVRTVGVGVTGRSVRVLVGVHLGLGHEIASPSGDFARLGRAGHFADRWVVTVMSRNSGTCVFGVENGVDDELADMVVLQPVEHCRALAAGANQPRHAEFGQVLRHRRRGLADMFGEFVHRTLGRGERPQNLNARGIGEHAEHLDDECGLLVGQPIANHLTICIHTRIVAQCGSAGHHGREHCVTSPHS